MLAIQLMPLLADQVDFLREMFYFSLFVPPGHPPFPIEMIDGVELEKYHRSWGKSTDMGWIAYLEDKPIGAVWSRYFTAEDPGYGFIDAETPELGIAVLPAYRKQGVGQRLIRKQLEWLQQSNVAAVSLSVDVRNDALRLYERCGFQHYRQEETSITMIHYL